MGNGNGDVTLDNLDKRLSLLDQAVKMGFDRLTAELDRQLRVIEEQNTHVCSDIAELSDRLERRVETLEKIAQKHDNQLIRIEPWIDGMEKALWIIIGIIIVAATSGLAWAAVQAGAIK